jgi:hypothetical protein
LHPAVQVGNTESDQHDQGQQAVDGEVGVLTLLWLGVHERHGNDNDTAENDGDVGTNVDDWVESLSFGDTADIVSEGPEKKRQADSSPHLGEDVQVRGSPESNDHQNRLHRLREGFEGSVEPQVGRFKAFSPWKQDGGIQREDGDECEEESVEKRWLGQRSGELGVHQHEDDRDGQHKDGLQPKDGFRATHIVQHQDVLQVTQQRIVEADEEHHQHERIQFLLLELFDRPEAASEGHDSVEKEGGTGAVLRFLLFYIVFRQQAAGGSPQVQEKKIFSFAKRKRAVVLRTRASKVKSHELDGTF